MASAALLPLATASTTVVAPKTASPQAKTPLDEVVRTSGSTLTTSSVSTLPSARNEKSPFCPIAGITVSTAMVNSDPLTAMGRRRPLASGSPSSIFRHSRAVTLPFSAIILEGLVRRWNFTPSSSASLISCLLAGISAFERR